MVVIFLPLVGVALFWLIGRSVRSDRHFADNRLSPDVAEKKQAKHTKIYQRYKVARILANNESSRLSSDNAVTIYGSGSDGVEQIIEDMKAAKRYIHLDFYIVETGQILSRYIDIFQTKIAEGIRIRLVYDAFGTEDEHKASFSRLAQIGVDVVPFVPFLPLHNYLHFNYRNHRKIIVIDGCIGYTGGMNISDKHLDKPAGAASWRDTMVRVEGGAASDLEWVFRNDWQLAGGSAYVVAHPIQNSGGSTAIQIVASGPDSLHRGIMQQYVTMIHTAKHQVCIATPYFVPGEAIMTALKTAALSDVQVQIMMPYESDSKWLRWCMYSYLEELLTSGVQVYIYRNGFLHNKVVICDHEVVSIGTANLDIRSLETNFEVNAVIYEPEHAAVALQQFEHDKEKCDLMDLDSFRDRPRRQRMIESVARLLSPLL